MRSRLRRPDGTKPLSEKTRNAPLRPGPEAGNMLGLPSPRERGRAAAGPRGPPAPEGAGKKVRESRKKFLTAGQRTRNISPCASGGTESDGAPGGAPQNLENRILNSEEEKSQANDSCERKPGPSAHPQDGGRARAETKIGLSAGSDSRLLNGEFDPGSG